MEQSKSVIISEKTHDVLDKIKELTHVPLKYILEEAIQDKYEKTIQEQTKK
jgi:hypothetical protein